MAFTLWLNGAFDVLHHKHFQMFDWAYQRAKFLARGQSVIVVIGLDSDERIKQAKGPGRPYHNLKERKFNLLSIKNINDVVSFSSEEELIEILDDIKPDLRVLGSDWRHKQIVGQQHCKLVEFFERDPVHSTTNILSYFKRN